MRQSNHLSPALGGWGGPQTIQSQDVMPAPGGLWVTITSSKTIKTRTQAVALLVPAIPGSTYCPVAAWFRALQQLPPAPTFLARPGVPLTTRELTATVQEALLDAYVPHASLYTLHKLRQGGRGQACVAEGVDLTSIMAQGTWQYGAVHAYVPRLASSEAPQALALCFGSAQGAS